MKELKLGDEIEVGDVKLKGDDNCEKAIFIKYVIDGVIATRNIEDYKAGLGFCSALWETGYWRRIKEKKYVPFTFDDFNLFADKWVKEDNGISKTMDLIVRIDETGIETATNNFDYQEAFEQLEFLDGTPFGKEVK